MATPDNPAPDSSVSDFPAPDSAVVEFSVSDGLGVIRLNRPEARNAIDEAFGRDLHQAVQRCVGDETVRAVLIRAEGQPSPSAATWPCSPGLDPATCPRDSAA